MVSYICIDLLKIDLQRGEESAALSNHSIHYAWKNMESSYKNNKFKISASTWNDKFPIILRYSRLF